MKKYLSSLVLLISVSNYIAQSFIDFGPKILVGPSYLYNTDLLDNYSKYDYDGVPVAFGGGFKLAFDFNEHVAVVGEFIYTKHKQGYKFEEIDTASAVSTVYNKEIGYSSMQIPLMLRYNSGTMSYIEAGYVISMYSGITETFDGQFASSAPSDVSSTYSTGSGGLVLGFGSYVWGQDNFGISAGFRVRYDLNDFSAASSKTPYTPVYGLDNAVVGSTNPVSLMLTIEFNYDLGFYMAKSPCNGRRTLLIGNK